MRFRIALTLAIALLAASCGDDTGPATTAPAGDAGPGTTAVADAPGTMAPSPQNPYAPGAPGGVPSSECLELSMALSQAASMGMTGSGDFGDTVTALQAMATVAPPEIAADFRLLASAFAELGRLLAEAGIDFSDPATLGSPQAQQAFEEAEALFEGSDLEEASDRIDAYLTDLCG